MEKLSLFITFLLLVLGFLPLFRRFHKFLRFKRQIDKIPGPKCYPLVGTAWKFIGKSAPEIFRIASECRLTYPGGVYRFWHGLMPEIKVCLKIKLNIISIAFGSSNCVSQFH